ncbi:MAG TPA: MlaD family protein [Janthinobacterium sp.]|jgi:phospholipid/cholesterol/gamma-HCH transport system substrate-binding protein|nr:MlaD family protein [Janthinobacterium sp.]
MENRSHALMTGFFTITLLIAAVLFGLWFNRDRVERVPYLLATTLSVPGLNPQATVRYRGLDVGKVDSIKFDPAVAGQILVRIGINPDTPVTSTTFATLGYQGVTGIAYIQLDDEKTGSPRLATSAANPARIALRSGLFDQLEKRGQLILDQTEEVSAKLNALLSADNQKIMLDAFEDVSKTAKAYRDIPKELGPTLAKLPALTAQAQRSLDSLSALSGDARKLSNNLNHLATGLQAPDGPIARLTGTMDRVGASLEAASGSVELDALPHVIDLTDETRSSMRTLKRTMEGLNERPQSILLGAPDVPPGPGEPGFSAPTK